MLIDRRIRRLSIDVEFDALHLRLSTVEDEHKMEPLALRHRTGEGNIVVPERVEENCTVEQPVIVSYIPLIRSEISAPILADYVSAAAAETSVRSCHCPSRNTKLCDRSGENAVQNIAASDCGVGAIEAVGAVGHSKSIGGESCSRNNTVVSVSTRVIGVAAKWIIQCQCRLRR